MKHSKTALIVISLIFSSLLLVCVYECLLSPPLVISSGSMQHDENRSELGILDTGDLVLLDYEKDPAEIMTYAQSVSSGYSRFGEYGDVILYQTDLSDIPIIHRAICRINYDGEGTFSIPELSLLPIEMWSTASGGWEHLTGMVYLYHVGHQDVTVPINLDKILKKMGDEPHGGFLTMGDNNLGDSRLGKIGYLDQTSLSAVDAPISEEEVIGVAAAEIPWAGVLKLTIMDKTSALPLNSIFCFAAVIISSCIGSTAIYFILKKAAS